MFTSTPLPFAALLAFAALGANLLGTVLLILLNPHSRGVRWHSVLSFWIMAWLALQGWFALGHGTVELLRVYGWAVHIMPAAFVAAALVEAADVRNRTAFAVLLVAVATMDVLNPTANPTAGIVWQALMWGAGATLHLRDRRRSASARKPGENALKLTLLVVVPVAVVGVIVLSGGFLLYVMPLLTIVIQFLIFVGVVHHRFYDIEVRAARSGELAAQAAEQERLALLGELSATLAHEIRNPLTGLRSLTQRLAGPQVDDARRTRYAGVILGEVGRLERIADNLLTIGRRSVVRDATPVATPLEPLFDDLLLLVEGRARRAQVTLERTATSAAVAAPRDALAQALLNLLLNAVAHTPPGGRVTLTARASTPAITVPPARDADVLRGITVQVTDTGPGVPLDARETIFEPFHTRSAGAGLGLAVVRRLARELKWEVGVTDAPGGGACFHITVPVHTTGRIAGAGVSNGAVGVAERARA